MKSKIICLAFILKASKSYNIPDFIKCIYITQPPLMKE